MTDLIAWVLLGGAIGFYYSWRRLAANTAHSIAGVESTQIDLTDKHARLARAQTIGRIKGLRIGASLLFAAIGGVAGFIIWLAASALVWAVE